MNNLLKHHSYRLKSLSQNKTGLEISQIDYQATDGDEDIRQHADDVFYIPAAPEYTAPILSVVPLQLFAYHTAVLLRRDVDKPRNLAKSVTVP